MVPYVLQSLQLKDTRSLYWPHLDSDCVFVGFLDTVSIDYNETHCAHGIMQHEDFKSVLVYAWQVNAPDKVPISHSGFMPASRHPNASAEQFEVSLCALMNLNSHSHERSLPSYLRTCVVPSPALQGSFRGARYNSHLMLRCGCG